MTLTFGNLLPTLVVGWIVVAALIWAFIYGASR